MASTQDKIVLDQFYTHPEVAEECLTIWQKHVINPYDGIVIEPSAGTGSFSKLLNCIAYDLDPKHPDVIQQDFLKLNLNQFGEQPLHFVGNPPFGRCGKVAFDFINKITAHPKTKSFAFILPVSFNRDWVQNRIDANYYLQQSIYVDRFIANGKNKKVKCCFQVWVKQDQPRQLVNMRLKSNLVSFVPDPTINRCDFKIGNKKTPGVVYAGDHTSDRETKSTYRGIIVHDERFKKLLNKFVVKGKRLVKVNMADFVGPPSTTQSEIIIACEHYYNKYLNH